MHVVYRSHVSIMDWLAYRELQRMANDHPLALIVDDRVIAAALGVPGVAVIVVPVPLHAAPDASPHLLTFVTGDNPASAVRQ